MPQKVPEPGFYHHYKHDPLGPLNNYAYEVVGVGFHTEKEEHFVNYLPLYPGASVYNMSLELGVLCLDNRPLEMWMGEVEVGGQIVPRFRRITDPDIIKELKKIRNDIYQSLREP